MWHGSQWCGFFSYGILSGMDPLSRIADRIQGVLLWPAIQAETRGWRGARIIARVNLFVVVALGLALLAWATGGF